ncbi:MAG: hypothetical protein ACK4TO_07090 [Candidatus Nitrosotenuis sp.]
MVASSVYVNQSVYILPNPYALSIKPRLEYCSYLVNVASDNLKQRYEKTRESNTNAYSREDVTESQQFKKQVELESDLLRASEILRMVKKRLKSITRLSNIAENVSPLISLIRIINTSVYSSMPQNHDLIELSTTLGSIVMDSGCLAEAKFDFKQTNLESTQILAEVNLIVDSKIRKQYPQLNF